jgi:2-oxoglutarate dehydrogenase E1 component
MNTLLDFHGPNAGYALELYEQYQRDPSSVDAETRAFFGQGFSPDTLPPSAAPAGGSPAALTEAQVEVIVRVGRVARLVREMGHADAKLDPLGVNPPPGDPELSLSYHGLSAVEVASLPARVVGGPCAQNAANALEALECLRRVYSGTVGYEDDHIQIPEERNWFREAIESRRFFGTITDEDRRTILEQLIAVDSFEQFLERVQPYKGQKRFSIEGIDMLVPVLNTLIHEAAKAGTRELVIGMAHRGRLSVLTHVLGKSYEAVLAEFPTDPRAIDGLEGSGGETHAYTGDVKYHKGFRLTYKNGGSVSMPVTLAPNPSHLEFVNPAVVGRARAGQESRDSAGQPKRDILASLAVQVHGDAAFPGQGVVAETLNLSQLSGYRVGGTIHLIANNQIGFTTNPQDGRSTMYASDLAKGFEIPIVHVNADDPEACLAVTRMAVAYRQKFGKDFLIDLVGYRRLGHNEQEEPAFTQPQMYEKIRQFPRLREKWATELIRRGQLTPSEVEMLVEAAWKRLEAAKEIALQTGYPKHEDHPHPESDPWQVETAVAAERLQATNAFLNAVPEGFAIDSKLEKAFLGGRRAALDGERKIVWAHAEALAYASLLEEGIPIRLTGQDTQRGTFTQRQMVWHDVKNGKSYCAHQHLPDAKASLAVYNSPLSETAALGFEYGYSVHAEGTLVLWEAQFGDFVNGAQVIIDQFIVSGKAKWEQNPTVVLLLPHGYEGAGPEHSSARLERFLLQCAGGNLRVANCSTAAQYFHLLRRQAATLRTDPRPLVVMTPKSLLRHARAAATLTELAEGGFQAVIDDTRDPSRKKEVTRLVLCSGKVYYDLVYGAAPQYTERSDYLAAKGVAIARVEQLYPFPAEDIEALAASYPSVQEIVWLQEEPQNMGAWIFMAPRLERLLGFKPLYIGRPEEASPAEGSQTTHNTEQHRIVTEAFLNVPARKRAK